MLKLGIILTAATVTILTLEFFRARRRPLPAHGWLGLLALGSAEFLMFRGIEPVATYFTPIAWTAYILVADAATFAISGESRLRDEPRGLLKMALFSVPLWCVFEAYNLRLANWRYVGLPESLLARWFGYGWSFATITPAIFMTASMIESLGWFAAEAKPICLHRFLETVIVVLGAIFLLAPFVVPKRVAAYLFALVWLGFLFLLDPINRRLDLPSFTGDLARGYRARLYSFLVAGWVCGWLWEFWNYWANAKWVYTLPMFQQWKVFEMPAPGYLGFHVFALECFAMYVTGAGALRRKSVPAQKYHQ